MANLFLTPNWFAGVDLIFEAVGFLVAMLIAGYSWKVYSISKESKFKYFSFAFLLISFSLLLKGITSSAVYFGTVRDVAEVVLGSTVGHSRQYSTLYYNMGFFLEMVTMLGGWLLIFFVSQKGRERLKKFHELTQIGLFVYLVMLISWIANFRYVVFFLTGAVLLSLIVLNYYKSYLNNGNKNTKLVMVSFLLMFIAYVSFIFIIFNTIFYVVGQVFLLLGFIMLLFTYSSIKSK
jgi:hypothetical protein